MNVLIISSIALAVPEMAAELDFSGLPPKGVAAYRFAVGFEFAGNKRAEFPLALGKAAEPVDAVGGITDELKPGVFGRKEAWSFREDGLRLTVIRCDGAPIRKVTVTGQGPRPTARWIVVRPD